MRTYALTHLGDGELMRDLSSLVAKDRATLADLLAHLAEVDERRLYVPAGYPSMFEYCVRGLRFSEQTAYKRILCARTARRFPALLTEVASGQLHLSAVILLAPHLTEGNASELMAACCHKSKADIEQLLATRFPKPDVPQELRALPPRPARPPALPVASSGQLSPGIVQNETAPGTRVAEAPRPRVTPLAPERFALQVTISRNTQEKLQYARELMSHQVPSGDVAHVLDKALDALITKLEKTKFAATDKPRKSLQRAASNKRRIPAEVKRAVWHRDKGRCTFVSEAGNRCDTRRLLEYDHAEPVARGGLATVKNLRLRCRSHNQYEAECAYGAGFMHEIRKRVRQAGGPARKGP